MDKLWMDILNKRKSVYYSGDGRFSRKEVRAMYLSWNYYNFIPSGGDLKDPTDETKLAIMFLSMICEHDGVNFGSLLDKVSRYEKGQRCVKPEK